MKNIVIILISLVMASCGTDGYRAKVISTGQLITVCDYYDVQPEVGDTVVCRKLNGNEWTIDNNASGHDTLYLMSDSVLGRWIIEDRVVKLVRAL